MSHAADIDRAVDVILRHPAMQPSEIAALVGCGEATVSRAFDKLTQCAAERGLAGLMTRILGRMDAIEARLTMLESQAGAGSPGMTGSGATLGATSRMLTLAAIRHGGARPAKATLGGAAKK